MAAYIFSSTRHEPSLGLDSGHPWPPTVSEKSTSAIPPFGQQSQRLILNLCKSSKNTGKIQLTIAGPLVRHIQATRQGPQRRATTTLQ